MKNKKKTNKKIYITFIVVMAVLYGAGYLVGSLMAKGERNGSLKTMLEVLKKSMTVVVPPLYLVLAVASLIVVCILYLSCKKMHKNLQENPDDELWDCLEEKLNQPLILSQVMTIANLFFFGSVIWMAEFMDYGQNGGYEKILLAADIVLFFVILICGGMLIPKGIVDIEKKLNPEKEGDVFDFKFNEVWFSSCDEAQKLIVYQATYQAYKNTNLTCVVLYVLTFIGMLAFKTGIFPMLCVFIVMLVNSLSYMLRAAELERRN